MDDVERQIEAWAEAAAPAGSGVPVDAGEVLDDTAPVLTPSRRGGRRWLAPVAAVVVLLAGAVAVWAVVDDDREPVETAATTTTTVARGLGTGVTFDVLSVGLAGEEPMGTLRSASTEEQFHALWEDTIPLEGPYEDDPNSAEPRPGPMPTVDFDEQVVVSIVIADDLCPPTLERFDRDGDRITPVFVEPSGGCRKPLVPKRFVVAIDWASVADRFELHLPGDDLYDYAEATIRLDRARPDPVLIDLELPTTTVEAGGTIEGQVVISNNSGDPAHFGFCMELFVIRIEGMGVEVEQGLDNALCSTTLTAPPGETAVPAGLTADQGRCTPVSLPDSATCGPDESLDLPPGEYQVEATADDLVTPPVAVTVT